jgi:hypothetical protein
LETRSTEIEGNFSTDDLDRAITVKEQALTLTLPESPLRVKILLSLAVSLFRRYELAGSLDDFARASDLLEEAALSTTASPALRIHCAAILLSRLLVTRDIARAHSISRQAINLFPLLNIRAMRRKERQYYISQLSWLTSLATGLILECNGTAYEALQTLEIGRGAIATLSLETQSDLSPLRAMYPALADRFDSIRRALENSHSSFHELQMNVDLGIEHCYSLSKELDTLISRIRQLEGFDRFLLGPSEIELTAIAGSDAIVIFNVTDIRSDAIIVHRHRISFLHLALLTTSELRSYTRRLLRAVVEMKIHEGGLELSKVLEWLWDVAVKTILDYLGFTHTPSDGQRWPRIWWVGSGFLNIFPIHAAGYHHNDLSGQCTIDRVVSSYTPTIKALAHARGRVALARTAGQQKTLLVGMPQTPGMKALPFVEPEFQKLHQILQQSPGVSADISMRPTRSDVLQKLTDYQIVHFSCHGWADEDPSESTLLLHDWRTNPLTVSDLSAQNLPKALFAFLSACNTASSFNEALIDESITLSAAIHLAGFPSVIGTLWPIFDQEGAEVAIEFYEWMLQNEGRFDVEKFAEGLHRVVRALKEKTQIVRGF